jgi:hypothetical protein
LEKCLSVGLAPIQRRQVPQVIDALGFVKNILPILLDRVRGRISGSVKASQNQEAFQVVNLEGLGQRREIQLLTDPSLQVDLQRIDTHRDRGGITSGGEKSISVLETIRGGDLEITHQGTES